MTASENMKGTDTELLEDVKRLLILQLLSQGVQQTHIAAVLGISDATMSRMLPKGLAAAVKKAKDSQ